MQRQALLSLVVVSLVVLAGCSGGLNQGDEGDATVTTGSTEAAESTDERASQGYSVRVVSQHGGSSDGVDFYLSDEENAIGDFAHLNVTITRVGFHHSGDDNESGGWVEREVEAERSVDLTRLRGANATRLTTVDVPNGSYDKVFAYVGDVNATLTSGEQVRVKLPSEKLHVKKPFTVGASESPDFVFDIAVHEAGNSGKYVLKPVVGESGTDVPIDSVDEETERGATLNLSFVGNVTRGANATIEATRNATAVENATVSVDDEQVGTTDAEGRLTFEMPDAEEVAITISAGESETELEVTFEQESEEEPETTEPTETVEPTETAAEAETLEPTETAVSTETAEPTEPTNTADTTSTPTDDSSA